MPITQKEYEQAKLSEHDFIVQSVKKHYKSQGFTIFIDKKIGRFKPDIIAIKNENLVVAVEAKPNDATEIRKGVGQCFSYNDWVHQVFLATSPSGIQLSNELLRSTPIGILTVSDDKVIIVKEAEKKEPDNLRLIRLLSNTTGFCWICRRSFNVVGQAQREAGGTYIAHKDIEPSLFKALEQSLGKKIRTKGSWVPVCIVCSRIIGNAIHEYLTRLFEVKNYTTFDFEELLLEEDKKLLTEFINRKK